MQRGARKAEATWHALRDAVRRSAVASVDVTGGMAEAQLRWLWSVVSNRSRSARFLGSDLAGLWESNGWRARSWPLSAPQMPLDWQTRYGYRPLLLETLVDTQRFRGTCYRGANWLHVGQTAGRGRMDREHQNHGQAIKDIYMYPLVRGAREHLYGDSTR